MHSLSLWERAGVRVFHPWKPGGQACPSGRWSVPGAHPTFAANRAEGERGMRVHHLNCITMCPPGGRLMDGRRRPKGVPAALVCHTLLLETDQGLVLVDTGFGLEDVRNPRPRLSPFFLNLNRPRLNEDMTAVRQIERLGFKAEDVRHIVLTHLDFDHAGGLDDFPMARVHVMNDEVEAAAAQRTWLIASASGRGSGGRGRTG